MVELLMDKIRCYNCPVHSLSNAILADLVILLKNLSMVLIILVHIHLY